MEDSYKYQITVSKDQYRLIANILEDACRFAAGQTRLQNMMSELTIDLKDSIEVEDRIHYHLDEIKRILYPFLGRWANYGYNGSNEQSPSQKRFVGNMYQIYREMLHFLAKDEGWDNVYNGVTLPSGDMGKISITKIKDNG